MRKLILRIVVLLLIPLSLLSFNEAEANNSVVYVANIDDEITKGLAIYVDRAIKTAEEEGARAIIFQIDTYGGFVDAADTIGKHLTNTDIQTVAYLKPNAISAGAYIALNMDRIYWAPNGQMGAATAITSDGNAADAKTQSLWISKMRDAAERGGRDEKVAAAMVDINVDLPEYNAPIGDLLTLNSSTAIKAGYADGIVNGLDEILADLGLANATTKNVDVTWADRIAGLITNSIVVPILLSLGSLGLILELYSPGFGAPGIVGLSSLGLFFYGHLIAGLAGMESLILFIIGIILLILELFVPGGILGFIGLGSVILSILLAGENVVQMSLNLLIALLVTITAMVILMKFFGKKINLISKLVLKDSTNTEQGYVSNENRTELINKTGVALTPLRPSGTIIIDNERIDAVSEGGFINGDAKVVVVEVEGVRIVVRELKDEA